MPAHASRGISVDVFSCATSLDCIERLRPEWDELYRNCASPHLGLTFNTLAANIFFRRETEDWWLFVARGDVGLVGAVFGYTDVLPVGRLRLPIFHAGIEHVSDPVLRKGLETVAATAILEAIYRTLPRCVLVQFDSLRIDASEVLCSSASHTHHLIRTESAPPVYWFDVTGHEKKELGKGRNLKRNLRRAQAKLDRDHGFSFEFRCTRDRDVNRDQCEQFFRLEAAGWKGRNGGAIGCSQWQSSYWRHIVEREGAAGSLLWCSLSAGGEVIAMYIGIASEDVLWLPKTAFCERYRAYSPGQLLLERLVTGATGSVLDSKIVRVDALYSPEWLSGWRPLEEQRKVTRVFRRSIFGSIAYAGVIIKAAVKKVAQTAGRSARADRPR